MNRITKAAIMAAVILTTFTAALAWAHHVPADQVPSWMAERYPG